MPKRLLAAIILGAGPLAACGGASQDRATAPPSTAAPRSASPASPPGLPASVPLRTSRAADPGRTKVIRAWVGALRAGDVARASALWAVPSKAQNGTPVLRLASRADILAFNGALPCGSVLTSAGGAERGFTIATVRLTKRRGADCGGAVGAIARTAIRVRDGRIVEWYRLPDDPDAPGLKPAPPPDVVESTIV